MTATQNTKNTKAATTKGTARKAVAKPDTTVSAQLIVTKSLATSILAPYRETDTAKANKVLSLLKFTGKGHTAESIIRDTLTAAQLHGLTIPTGFASSEVGLALGVARAMATIEKETTKSASAGIAAALVDIHRAHGSVGGGKAGMIAALDAAQNGTSNGAEVAERLTTVAATITDAENTRRRARAAEIKARGARPEGNAKAVTADADTDTKAPAVKATGTDSTPTAPATTAAPEAASPLASASLARLIAEIDARIVGGAVPTLADQAKFDALAANWELALESVDA